MQQSAQSTGDNYTLQYCIIQTLMNMQKVNKQICRTVNRVFGTDEGRKFRDRHPALTHPTASAINSAVITNNGIRQRSVSYLTGPFDNRVYRWKWLVRSLPRQGYTRVFEVRAPQEQ